MDPVESGYKSVGPTLHWRHAGYDWRWVRWLKSYQEETTGQYCLGSAQQPQIRILYVGIQSGEKAQGLSYRALR